jgi:hypothetical protein
MTKIDNTDCKANEDNSMTDSQKSNTPPMHWSNKPFPGWLQMLIFFTWIMAMIFFVVPEFIKMFGKVKTTVSDTMEYQTHKNICTQLIKTKSPYPDFVTITKVKLATHDKDKGFYLYQVDARQNNQQGLPQNEMYFVGFISKGEDITAVQL